MKRKTKKKRMTTPGKQIRVDLEVFNRLGALAKGYESRNDTMRRLLSLKGLGAERPGPQA